MNILVAPLDWGLGHTTRCVPLIQHLLQAGHRVIFAGNDSQRAYISGTFPGITTIQLDGYNVNYSRYGSAFMLAIAKQVPTILRTIREEHNWLNDAVKTHSIDAVISDNRYGLYHSDIPCVIMTHQLSPISGMGSMADKIVHKLHYRMLERFNHCWIVDVPQAPGLAGKLSHPPALPRNAEYIGLLSQAEQKNISGSKHLLVLLSGPEPQRTLLADKLWQQAKAYKGPVVFVEGSENVSDRGEIPQHIIYHKRISGDILAHAISDADMVICRSGYSTIMDLVKLNKKAILIPTPGQTEQEYLAIELYRQKLFISKQQATFNLDEALEEPERFSFSHIEVDNAYIVFLPVVDKWLHHIASRR